jgi:Vps51/Vps67/Exocyst component 84 C-terminal
MTDLVEFFGEEQFDASEYVKKFFENNSAAGAAERCEELEGLRRQTEESLRQEVVRNYQTFMHATAQIQSMERDIDALRSLLSTASSTLTSFQTVRLVDRQEGSSGNRQQSSANLAQYTAFGSTATATSLRGLKLPEWLDKAPTELEELLLERKHDVAVKLIRQVKGFAANVRNATNLGRGVAAIFAQADDMAAALSRRLISEITGSNTFTAWGFREHKKNFQLLIDLGYADAAAAAFVKERSSLIRRALHMVSSSSCTCSQVLLLKATAAECVHA